MDEKIGIIGNEKYSRLLFLTIINVLNIKYNNIYVTNDIFTNNNEYLKEIYLFDKENLTNQLFFYPKNYIIENYVREHRFFNNLKENMKSLKEINVLENYIEIVKTVDILFIIKNTKQINSILNNINNNMMKNILIVLVDSNKEFNKINKKYPELKIFKTTLDITPISQYVVRLCYNNNVKKK
jgi:hypothetical protein